MGRVANEKKEPLTDNNFIEQHLAHIDVLCMEDVIHELFTVGPHFKEVNQFIWNFKLNSGKDDLKSRTHFSVGGSYGDRGQEINQLLRNMI